MRALGGQPNDVAPFSSEEGAKWLMHLKNNIGLSVAIESQNGQARYLVNVPQGAYRTLDDTLREREHALVERLTRGLEIPKPEMEQLEFRIWTEANQTCKVQSELERLTRAYNLVPAQSEWKNYTLNQMQQQLDGVLTWVIYGETIPPFLYERNMLIENDVDDGTTKTIRPWKWPEDREFSRERMPLNIRIRTWMIYYLSVRGGGNLNDQGAVTWWN